MSAPVDVLAALQQIADGEGDIEVTALRVRAAVAELIEAANSGRVVPTAHAKAQMALHFYPKDAERLLLALKRAGGAA